MSFLNENLLYLSFVILCVTQIYLFFIPPNTPQLILFFTRLGLFLCAALGIYAIWTTVYFHIPYKLTFGGLDFSLDSSNSWLFFSLFFSTLCSSLLLSTQTKFLHRNASLLYLGCGIANLTVLLHTFTLPLILTYFVALCFNILLAHSTKPFRGSTIYQSAIYFLACDLLSIAAFFMLSENFFILPKPILGALLLSGPLAHLGLSVTSPLLPALFNNSPFFSRPLLLGQLPACALAVLMQSIALLKSSEVDIESLIFATSFVGASISIAFVYYNQNFHAIIVYSFSFLMAMLSTLAVLHPSNMHLLFLCSLCACSAFLLSNPTQKKHLSALALIMALAPPGLGAGSYLWLQMLQLPFWMAGAFIALWAVLWVLGIYLLRVQNFSTSRAKWFETGFIWLSIACCWVFTLWRTGY